MPNDQIIEDLRDALDRAERGELVAIAFVAFLADDIVLSGYHADSNEAPDMIAELSSLGEEIGHATCVGAGLCAGGDA